MDLTEYSFGTVTEMVDIIKEKKSEGWELPNYMDLKEILTNLDAVNKANLKVGNKAIADEDLLMYSDNRLDPKTFDISYEHCVIQLKDVKNGAGRKKYIGQKVKVHFVRNL